MKKVDLEKVVKKLIGQELCKQNLLKEINNIDPNIKQENISILNGYKTKGENFGWVTLVVLQNRVRVRVTDDSIILG